MSGAGFPSDAHRYHVRARSGRAACGRARVHVLTNVESYLEARKAGNTDRFCENCAAKVERALARRK